MLDHEERRDPIGPCVPPTSYKYSEVPRARFLFLSLYILRAYSMSAFLFPRGESRWPRVKETFQVSVYLPVHTARTCRTHVYTPRGNVNDAHAYTRVCEYNVYLSLNATQSNKSSEEHEFESATTPPKVDNVRVYLNLLFFVLDRGFINFVIYFILMENRYLLENIGLRLWMVLSFEILIYKFVMQNRKQYWKHLNI